MLNDLAKAMKALDGKKGKRRPTNREGRTHEKTKQTTQGSTTPNKHKQQAKQRAHGVQSEVNTHTHRGAIDPAKSKKGVTSQGKLKGHDRQKRYAKDPRIQWGEVTHRKESTDRNRDKRDGEKGG